MLIIELMKILAITIIIEIVALAIYKKLRLNIDIIFALMLGNIITNPLLNLSLITLRLNYYTMIVIGEVLAIVIECLIFNRITHENIKESVKISLVINSISYLVGKVIA